MRDAGTEGRDLVPLKYQIQSCPNQARCAVDDAPAPESVSFPRGAARLLALLWKCSQSHKPKQWSQENGADTNECLRSARGQPASQRASEPASDGARPGPREGRRPLHYRAQPPGGSSELDLAALRQLQ
ncbi:hypothetical protein SKAU_G00148380 [Synaphobranchus kaupii]|uniref:Uncharacterized protein n=1 Tax=Synaphobranchus kaupii TaxID=118154 RepID=A0A9Q1FTQ4_SYNKA|nr:hypothetical protein SKAU_G00148380 [Synaphobranchus kaupii]